MQYPVLQDLVRETSNQVYGSWPKRSNQVYFDLFFYFIFKEPNTDNLTESEKKRVQVVNLFLIVCMNLFCIHKRAFAKCCTLYFYIFLLNPEEFK